MKQKYWKTKGTGKPGYTPPPDLRDTALAQYGDPFAAADALEDAYFRLVRDAPPSVRRNMFLHVVLDKAHGLLNGEGILPSEGGLVPTQAERDYWTRHFPGQQYTPSYNSRHKP